MFLYHLCLKVLASYHQRLMNFYLEFKGNVIHNNVMSYIFMNVMFTMICFVVQKDRGTQFVARLPLLYIIVVNHYNMKKNNNPILLNKENGTVLWKYE